jgi:hypothetical protein
MKFASSQLGYLLRNREARANIRTLLRYLLTLLAIIALCAVVFHVIKMRVEGEQHSWVTGFYWTLVVMTTLGFGDITFTSDTGRLFSIVVLMSGVVPCASSAGSPTSGTSRRFTGRARISCSAMPRSASSPSCRCSAVTSWWCWGRVWSCSPLPCRRRSQAAGSPIRGLDRGLA